MGGQPEMIPSDDIVHLRSRLHLSQRDSNIRFGTLFALAVFVFKGCENHNANAANGRIDEDQDR